MSNQTLPPRPLPPARPTVPHITATFEGGYYKGVVGAMEVHPFKETILVPDTWLLRDDMHPAAVFKIKFARKLLAKKYPGYNDVRTVHLVDTSELPSGMSVEQELNWTADFAKLIQFAKKYASQISFIPLDPKEGTPLPRQTVGVRPEFYSDVNGLRNAIKRCMAEPQAFAAEQEKLSKGYEKRKNELTMQEEMDALYPDGF